MDFDAFDWWFRTSFAGNGGAAALLRIDGLATIADVWLNGRHLLRSENMFQQYRLSVELADDNEIVIVCRSLKRHLAGKRPRPRWKTRIVENQQLRFVRTTLLGRMPSWTPPAPPVGIWRAIEIVPIREASISGTTILATLDDRGGRIAFTADLDCAEPLLSVRLIVEDVATAEARMDIACVDGVYHLSGDLSLPGAEPWWPHTHGAPTLYRTALVVELPSGTTTIPLGKLGFRSIEVDRSNDRFDVAVNEVPVFCRGACWVPLDVVTLQSSRESLGEALQLVVDAGMNMIRLTGPMVYETEEFYDLCDQFGVLVWQDLMFANMDYPTSDETFAGSVSVEIESVLRRLSRHPSVAVVCGGSEVEQQASMMGVRSDAPINELGRIMVPALVEQIGIGAEYVQCSPIGGVFPFVPNAGVSHYYGVGAYLLPLDDARRAGVRFTSECLAFANVPARQTVEALLGDGERPAHSPRWKARVPRDRGSGWDFEDVRDHYVRTIFGVDPLYVRYSDPERYLDLGRAAVVVAMESSLSEWRRPESSCSGSLVLLLRDLWLGAGWGVIDSDGRPKSAYYAIKRASAPVAVLVTDEGLNGLMAHVINDRPEPLCAVLSVRLFGEEGLIACATADIALAGHGSVSVSADAMFSEFRDLNFTYRFGPARYDVVNIALVHSDGTTISEVTHLARGHARIGGGDPGLSAALLDTQAGQVVRVRAQRFAHFVSLELPGFIAGNNWFHLVAGAVLDVPVWRHGPGRGTGEISALNASGPTVVQ